MKLLVIDNYDSFTFNLVHYLDEIAGETPVVMRNNEIDFDSVKKFDRVVLSPGPGLPKDSGDLMKFIDLYHSSVPILGVCLGQQAIAVYFGGELQNMALVKHGVAEEITIDTTNFLYRGFPEVIQVARYHSWAVHQSAMPSELVSTSIDPDGFVMSFQHRELPVTAVQYHPESILTPLGKQILRNWVNQKF